MPRATHDEETRSASAATHLPQPLQFLGFSREPPQPKKLVLLVPDWDPLHPKEWGLSRSKPWYIPLPLSLFFSFFSILFLQLTHLFILLVSLVGLKRQPPDNPPLGPRLPGQTYP